MPRKPKKPCSFPGCPNLCDGRYCEEHERLINKQYEKYERNPESRTRYGKTWRRIRSAYAEKHPLCEECLKKGLVVPMEQVHHIKPLSEGGSNDFSNLVSLCTSCHSRIHAERGDRWNSRRQKT